MSRARLPLHSPQALIWFELGKGFGHEVVARHFAHRFEHARVADAIVCAQPFDHLVALASERPGLRGGDL